MVKPIVSIVIPTRNSENILDIALKGIASQNCPKKLYEVIVVDNESTDGTRELANKYGARVIKVEGKPPQVCRQRNMGADKANGEYVLFLDHDVELSPNLLNNFIDSLKNKEAKEIDAWYIPYRNVASSKLLTEIRNLEDEFYLDSVVAAARLIKKYFLVRNQIRFDPNLSSGPADWDFNIQLKLAGAKFGRLKDFVYHHEESLGFWRHITKKENYIKGGEIYKGKWRKRSKKAYETIVKKQYDPLHRLFIIFVEKGKWRKLLPKIHIYLLFLIMKSIMAIVYLYNFNKLRKSLLWLALLFLKNPQF